MGLELGFGAALTFLATLFDTVTAGFVCTECAVDVVTFTALEDGAGGVC